MNVYCNNYATCNSVILDWSKDRPTDDMLRARGWRTWNGLSMTGAPLDVILCEKCCSSTRPKPTQVLEGQEELF